MNTEYFWLQSPNQFDFWISFIKFCNSFVTTSGSMSYGYFLIWQIDCALSFAVQFQFSPKTLCFRIYQKAKMALIFGLLWELAMLEQNQSIFYHPFSIFVWILIFLKNCEILQVCFLTKVVLESTQNGVTCMLCTILEWKKCQEFTDFIEFVLPWFIFAHIWKNS